MYGVAQVGLGEAGDCPWRWPGQYEDTETGLDYNRFRYYDADRAGYLSQDPIRAAGGLELYSYSPDPLLFIDPLGLTCKSGAEVTPEEIQAAMADAPLATKQSGVSVPVIAAYVDRLAAGESPPPIKVDDGVIVDGNHKYIAGRLFGIEPATTPGTMPSFKKDLRVIPWDKVTLWPTDWGNR